MLAVCERISPSLPIQSPPPSEPCRRTPPLRCHGITHGEPHPRGSVPLNEDFHAPHRKKPSLKIVVVETAFLVQGLLWVRQHFRDGAPRSASWPNASTGCGAAWHGTGTSGAARTCSTGMGPPIGAAPLAWVPRSGLGQEPSDRGLQRMPDHPRDGGLVPDPPDPGGRLSGGLGARRRPAVRARTSE